MREVRDVDLVKERCDGCNLEFGYITQDDPVSGCRPCGGMFHRHECFDKHLCLGAKREDAKKLTAWTRNATSWRVK